MLQLAEQDLRAVGAQFTQLLTSVMISRLVLNLRSMGDTTTHVDSIGPAGAIRFVTGAIGNVELDDTSLRRWSRETRGAPLLRPV